MILCRLVLAVGFLLLGQAAAESPPSIRNDSRDFSSSPGFDRMTTFLYTEGPVYHMEPDLYINGNILFSDWCALKTSDGTTTTTIAGYAKICGYQDGIGTLSRFNHVKGFRQISPTEVVVADHYNCCLRLVNRITLHTSRYAGSCGSRGYADGTSAAMFDYPSSIIDDFKHPGMLIVTDKSNIRHINKLSINNPRPVTTFFRSTSALSSIRNIAQDPITGDMFITAQSTIMKLTYDSKSIISLAGGLGFRDCDFSYSLFNSLKDILIIDNNKLMVVDTNNYRLRLMDLDGETVTSFCSGVPGHSNGDMKTCKLHIAYSLMVLNDSLYVGQQGKIRKIQDSRITACSKPEIRQVSSAITGVASVDIPLLAGMFKLDLPPGNYPAKIASVKANCIINIKVLDALVRRRLVMESHYNVSCDAATKRGLLDFQGLRQFVDVTYRQLEDVCQPDCSRAQIDVMLTCEVNILTVVWPTDIVYDGEVVAIPEDLEERLNEKIEAKGAAFYLYIQGHTPPFVYPNKEDNGGYVIPSIYSYCENEGYVYNKQKEACEKSLS